MNFKIEPKGIWQVSPELSKRLSSFTENRRRVNSEAEDIVEGEKGDRTLFQRVTLNGLQGRIGKVSKAIAQTEDPERREQLVDVVENMLSLAERELRR